MDKTNETLGKKIRSNKTKKTPYLLVVGEKEEKENTVSINARDNKEQEVLSLSQFTEKILKEIINKK